MPDGEADLARAVELGDLGEAKHLPGRDLADRDGDADVVQTWLLLRKDATWEWGGVGAAEV